MGKPTDNSEFEDEVVTKLTREEQREISAAYSDMAERLTAGKVTGSVKELPDPPFDEVLRKAVSEAQRFTKSAKQRQIRRLAGLLRQAGDIEELEAALEGRSPAMIAKRGRERANEAWRARLIEEGDAALAEFIDAYPQAERTRLRKLARQAARVPADTQSKRAGKALLKEIRLLTDVVVLEG